MASHDYCLAARSLALIGVLLSASAGYGQKRDPLVQRWQIDSFYADAGLTGKYVTMAVSDGEDGMWFAVSNGLHHYDGYRWKRYTTEHGLPSNYVRCVEVSPDGMLWVGTDKGAGTFADGIFRLHGTQDNLAGPSVRRIIAESDGTLWFCCDQWPVADVPAGLTRLRKGQFHSWGVEDGLPSDYVSDYFRDSSGRQFVLTRKGLAQFTEGGFIQPLKEAGLEATETYIWSMVESDRHGILVGTADHFYQWKENRWTQLPNANRRLEQPKLMATGDGEIYTAGYGHGLVIYQWLGDRFVPITPPMTDITGGTQFLVEDPHGAIWIGGYERLLRWERKEPQWTLYADRGRMRHKDAEGGIWCENSQVLSRYASGSWTDFPGLTRPIISDRNGRLWIQSSEGVVHGEPSGAMDEVEVPGLTNVRLQVLDAKGHVWVCGETDAGQRAMARYDGSRWSVTPIPMSSKQEILTSTIVDAEEGVWLLLSHDRLPPFRLLAIREDEVTEAVLLDRANASAPPHVIARDDGAILLGGYFGLLESKDRGASWQSIVASASAVTQLRRCSNDCWAVFSGHGGGNASVSRYRDETWKHFPQLLGRFAGRDKNRELYFASRGSIQVIPAGTDELPPPINTPFSNRAGTVVAGDGGELWMADGTHTYRYRPSRFPPDTQIVAHDDRKYHGDTLQFKVRGQEQYRTTRDSSKYNVSWRIDGGSWSPFQRLSDNVSLSGLDVGDHKISVRVMNEALQIDPTPAEFGLHVLPIPVQMRAWFRPMVTLAVVTIVALALLAMLNWFTIRRMAKGLEEEVERRGERLDTTEREFQMLFENSQDAICLFGVSGNLKACNRSARELLGLSDRFERSIEDLLVDPGQRARFREELDQKGYLRGLRFRVKGKDAKELVAIVSASTHTQGDDNVVGYQVIIRDISDLVDLQRSLRETRKMEAIGRMAGGIAHDFNNFLAVVMYGADLIRLQKRGDDGIEKGVRMVLDGAQRAKNLTSQIQTFSRDSSPKLEVIDTRKTLSQIPTLLKGILPENVQLSLQLADDLGRIQAGAEQVEQVLVNLAINAFHAMPDGGTLTVASENLQLDERDPSNDDDSFASEPCGSVVRITVNDTGHGIDDAIREQIFEPFFTTKPQGQGTGLGLAIVYGIIQQLRGSLRVESGPGQGCRFEILFPRVEQEVTHRPAESSLPSGHGNETILLVEDEQNIRDLVSQSLRSYGYQVHVAGDGQSALREIDRRESIHLLISDVVMTGMSGFDLVKQVRAARPEILILMISGHPRHSETELLDGFDVPLLRKPFAPADLAARVRQLLDTRSAEADRDKHGTRRAIA